MKKSELIAALQEIPGDPNVKIFDHLKCLHHASGEPSDEGIYDFEVSQLNHDLTPEEIVFTKEVHEIDPKPFIILSFDNEDFNEDGELVDPRDPKIKANEIFRYFFGIADPGNDSEFKDNLNRKLNTKECCFVAIDQIIAEIGVDKSSFWKSVRQEIETLEVK